MLELNPELERYIEAHSEPESDVLVELSRETHLNVLRPLWYCRNLQGQFQMILAPSSRPGLCWKSGRRIPRYARRYGLGMKKVFCTIDVNDELEDFTRRYIGKSGLQERIVFHVGDACGIIPRLDEMFDLVFIDADKREYSEYYRLVFDKVRSGGIIIADDVLWDGKVADPQVKLDAQTKGILDFNDMVQADQRVTNLLLPVRHGLMIVRKNKNKVLVSFTDACTRPCSLCNKQSFQQTVPCCCHTIRRVRLHLSTSRHLTAILTGFILFNAVNFKILYENCRLVRWSPDTTGYFKAGVRSDMVCYNHLIACVFKE